MPGFETSACLPSDALLAFDHGRLPEPELLLIADHLEVCPECRSRLASLDATPDPLAEAVRRFARLPLAVRRPDRTDDLAAPRLSHAATADFPAAPAADTDVGERTDPSAAGPECRYTLPAPRPPVQEPEALPPDLLAPPAPGDPPGTLGRLGGYCVVRVLGKGGMGLVFEAADTALKRRLALKVMLPKVAANPTARERFLREARNQAAVEHDHVAAIFQVGEDRGVPFLAMPLLRGESLSQRLEREPRPPLAEVLRIGREVAEGLAAAHEKGLIHRDIKPANLWLEGSRGRVKVLDFGLARGIEGDDMLTNPGGVLGTPAYMAPEQARGRDVDHRADLCSLGAVLYQMTTGRMAFQGSDLGSVLAAVLAQTPPSPAAVNPDVPRPVSDLVMSLLRKDPDRRPVSAREVVAAISQIEQSLGVGGAPAAAPSALTGPWQPPEPEPEPRAPRRWVPAAAVVGAVALLAIAYAAYQIWSHRVVVQSERGEIEVVTSDPTIEVTVKKDGVVIEDRSRNRQFRVVPGRYEVEVTNPATGERILGRRVIIIHGDREILRVEAKLTPKTEPKKEEPKKEEPKKEEPKKEEPKKEEPKTEPKKEEPKLPVVVQLDPPGSAHELARVTHADGLPATAAAFCPRGKYAAVGWEDGTTTVIDLAKRKAIHHFNLYKSDQSGAVRDLAFAHDEVNGHTLLVIGSSGGLLQLWRADTGERAYAIHHSKAINRVAFSPNAKWVATTDTLGWVHIRTTPNLDRIGQGEGGEPYLVAWVGSKLLIVRERDQVPMLWDLIGGDATRHYRPAGEAAPGAKVLLPGGKQLLVGEYRSDTAAGRLRLVNLEFAKEAVGTRITPAREVWGTDLPAPIALVAASAEAPAAAVALRPKGTVVAFDLRNGREVQRFAGHTDRVSGLAVSPDGRLVLSASSDRTARLWKVPELPAEVDPPAKSSDPEPDPEPKPKPPSAPPVVGPRRPLKPEKPAEDGVNDLAVGWDGTRCALDIKPEGANFKGLTWDGEAWAQKGVVAGVRIAVDPAGNIWEINNENHLWSRNICRWRRQAPGDLAFDVAFAPDGRGFALGGPPEDGEWPVLVMRTDNAPGVGVHEQTMFVRDPKLDLRGVRLAFAPRKGGLGGGAVVTLRASGEVYHGTTLLAGQKAADVAADGAGTVYVLALEKTAGEHAVLRYTGDYQKEHTWERVPDRTGVRIVGDHKEGFWLLDARGRVLPPK